MSSRTAFFFIAVALAIVLPSRSFAQLSVPGKVMTYRTVDVDSGEEQQRSRFWQASDGGAPVEMTVTTYPTGTRLTGECRFGNGVERPATSSRSVMLAANGELERSDFDTFDPVYYPFLSQPLTAQMQPGACLNRRALDLAALVQGAQLKVWMWSDSGLVGVIFQVEGAERLTVAAGTFDALRVGIDVDLSKLFPRVPALFLKLFKPHMTIWISRAEPYYVLKIKSPRDRSAQHDTAVELLSISELDAADSKMPPELDHADVAITEPQLTVINTGTFVQGDRTGHVTLESSSTSEGQLMVTHVAFNNGTSTESRTLIDHRASPQTVYLDDRSYGAGAKLARKHLLYFRKAAFPGEPSKDLPADLYGADTTLALVLPRLLPDSVEEARFHVMDFSGRVSELSIRKEGMEEIALTSDDARAIHIKLKPIVEVPLLLRPLAYFFIPTFDAYFDVNSTHRLLKFDGPLGPPGAPSATMIADEKPFPASASR